MVSTDLLGQNLFRAAIDDKSLRPFEIAAQGMYDPAIPSRCRADIFKAVRFGLAGVAIHGWQERITEPLDEPYELNGRTIGYRYLADYFPTDEEPVEPANDNPAWDGTSGWLTLQRVGVRSEDAMLDLLDDPAAEVEGIALTEVQSTLLTYVLAAHELGLDKEPNMFNGGTPLLLNIYDKYHGYGLRCVRYALGGAAQSLVASTVNGISAYMREAGRILNDNASSTDLHVRLNELFRHATRASQRQDGFHIVLDDKEYPDFTIGENGELMWERKYSKPPRRLAEGEAPTVDYEVDVLEAYLRRNKCPVGYTIQATDTMPIRKLSDSLLTYMIESGLDNPALFATTKL